uniref:Uncharacterized protein n=1 Tax=Panagrolaimus davidi TaxID=227884 RepID=A0A914PWY2_9BILA
MVKHIGIEPHLGKVTIYDTIAIKDSTISIDFHCNYPNECTHFFKLVCTKIGKLGIGNVVVCCDGKDSNDFRKACLQGAKNSGYSSCQIISKDVAYYIQAVLQTTFHVFEGQIICIIYTYAENKICMQIWNVKKDAAVMEYCFVVKQSESCWDQLKSKLKATRQSQLIFLVEACWKKEFSKYFGINPKTFEYSYSFFSEAAVIVARISANDKSVKQFNAQNTLNRDIIVNIGDDYVIEVERSRPIPLKEGINVNVTYKESVCKISETFQDSVIKSFTLPRSNHIDVMFTVNENGIYSFAAEGSLTLELFVHGRQSSIKTQPSFTSEDSFNIEGNTYPLPNHSYYYDFSTPLIGIDFGTTKCVAAINYQDEIETFDPDPLTSEPSLFSFVSYSELLVKCGQAAIYKIRNESRYTVFDVKRIIGRSLHDIKVDILWPFELAEGPNGVSIGVHTYTGKQWLTPEDIAAVLFKKIKTAAERLTKSTVTEAVITVPLNSNEDKTNAISNSAKAAGFQNFYLLAEPIAAIFAYHYCAPIPEGTNLLFFDFGGGTLNICVVTVIGEYLKVLSSGSDENLGGRDFDSVLLNYFITIMLTQHHIEVMASDKKKFKLMSKCKKIKHNLTLMLEQTLDVDDFDSNIDATISIKRNIFELISSELIERVKTLIKNTVAEAKIQGDEIQQILKIGGASKMPMIEELLENMFPTAEIINPADDEGLIAKGATLYGFMLKSGTNKATFY